MVPTTFTHAVIIPVPQAIIDEICFITLRDAIQQQFQVDIQLQDMSKYKNNYIVLMPSSHAREHMIGLGFIVVSTHTLTIMPWNQQLDSIVVPVHAQLSTGLLSRQPVDYSSMMRPCEHLRVELSGLPPHLCSEQIVQLLLNQFTTISEINFVPGTLACWISAYGRPAHIPTKAYIGVKRSGTPQTTLNFWPLQYEIHTEAMLGGIAPSEDRTSGRRGSSELDSAHRQELREQYYAYVASRNDEATSRIRDMDSESSVSSVDISSEGEQDYHAS